MIFLYLIVSYLVGTVMTAYIVLRISIGEDIRKQGSGNVGARNIGRLLGKKAFVITSVGDGLKGLFIVLVARYLFEFSSEVQLLALFFVVIGHIWPITLRFSGGKGIATFIGGLVAFDLKLVGIFIVVLLVFYLIMKSLTVACMSGFLLLPVFGWLLLNYSLVNILILMIIIGIVIFAHRDNLKERFNNWR